MKKILLTILLILITTQIQSQNIIRVAQNVYNQWSQYSKKQTVIIIDFSKPMEIERLYVVDMTKLKIIDSSKVCHGIGSGRVSIPTQFSNIDGSKMSSKGVMLTTTTYEGIFGYSLKLRGLEGCNSKCESRYIIFHNSQKQATPWSWGCFSMPQNDYKRIIDLTKEGSLIFVFSTKKDLEKYL